MLSLVAGVVGALIGHLAARGQAEKGGKEGDESDIHAGILEGYILVDGTYYHEQGKQGEAEHAESGVALGELRGIGGLGYPVAEEPLVSLEGADDDAARGEEEEDIEAMEVFFAQTYRCTVDSQNRIVIPPLLREYAKLEKDVVIVGANGAARIWDAARWNEKLVASATPERMKSLSRKLRL